MSNEESIHFNLNDNENTTHQILRDAVKSVLREKFIALNAYVRIELKINEILYGP